MAMDVRVKQAAEKPELMHTKYLRKAPLNRLREKLGTGQERPTSGAKEAAEKVAVANSKRPSAAKAGLVFNQLRTG
jgi:hypothetical protein